MGDGCNRAGPLTPLVLTLLTIAVCLLWRLQLTAIYLNCLWLAQDGLYIPIGDWILLLFGGVEHLHEMEAM